MQSVFDSLCRCFGTESDHPSGDALEAHTRYSNHGRKDGLGVDASRRSSSADPKKRTRSLGLQDRQWDGLFGADDSKSSPQSSNPSSPVRHSSKSAPPTGRNHHRTSSANFSKPQHYQQNPSGDISLQLAKVKLAANQQQQQQQTRKISPENSRLHKRKRSSNSRDDIFRYRRPPAGQASTPQTAAAAATAATRSQPRTQPNPFSRFLSSHPALANSLCFATPIRDSDDEPDEVPMENLEKTNSMVSDANTSLNTAEDTITSTLYYEKTKLAGLAQTHPPMPLFDTFAVEERDELRVILATESHSSIRMMERLRQQQQQQIETAVNTHRSEKRTQKHGNVQFVRGFENGGGGGNNNNNNKIDVEEDHHIAEVAAHRNHPNGDPAIVTPARRREGGRGGGGGDDATPPPMTHSSSGSSTRS